MCLGSSKTYLYAVPRLVVYMGLKAIQLLPSVILALLAASIATPVMGSTVLPAVITIVPAPMRGVSTTCGRDTIWNWVPIGYAGMDCNLWGIAGYKGSKAIRGGVVMEVTPSGILETRVNVSLGPEVKTFVVGYHEVIYGIKPWGVPPNHPRPIEPLALPLRVAELPRVIAVTNYSIDEYSSGINFAYDLWILQKPSTKGPRRGDLELMIWLFHDGIRPAGKLVETLSIPTVINGTLVRNATWQVLVLGSVPWGGWDYVAFVLKPPVRRGSVAVDLTQFIELAGDALSKARAAGRGGAGVGGMYLMSIELGTETLKGPNVVARWKLYRYAYAVFPRGMGSERALEVFANPSLLWRMGTTTATVTSTTTHVETAVKPTTVTRTLLRTLRSTVTTTATLVKTLVKTATASYTTTTYTTRWEVAGGIGALLFLLGLATGYLLHRKR